MTDRQTVRLSWPRRLAILACLATGCFFAFRAGSPTVIATTVTKPDAAIITPAPDLTVPTAPQTITQNIEDVQLGQRVVGTNPLREQTQAASEIDPKTWRAVRLNMVQSGVEYDLAFLRPLSWIQETGADVGRAIHLELHEMGLNGPADVVSIDACPEIEPVDGTGRNVVTGTMVHPGSNILYLDITGLEEPLGVTDTHPMWSETRKDFVVAGQLEVGEQFRTLTGEAATLMKVHPHRGPPELVFNLEVDGEHVYSVASNGLLVHNDCVDLFRAVSPEEFVDIMKSGNFKLHPNAMGVKQFGHNLDEVLQLAKESLPDAAAVVKTSVPRFLFDALNHEPVDASTLKSGATTVYREMLELFNKHKSEVEQVF